MNPENIKAIDKLLEELQEFKKIGTEKKGSFLLLKLPKWLVTSKYKKFKKNVSELILGILEQIDAVKLFLDYDDDDGFESDTTEEKRYFLLKALSNREAEIKKSSDRMIESGFHKVLDGIQKSMEGLRRKYVDTK